MAMIYDFPTNYEEKIDQATKLMEKGYIDQAICLLENRNLRDSGNIYLEQFVNFINRMEDIKI